MKLLIFHYVRDLYYHVLCLSCIAISLHKYGLIINNMILYHNACKINNVSLLL